MSPAAFPALPPSRVVDVGGAAVEYVAGGSGRPVLVLVNGAGGPLSGWSRVFERLAGLGTVVAWNRPGIGRSARPTQPQTGDAIVAGARALLGQAGLEPRYVLVGHSLGGLYVDLFARLHPTEVAGAVLLDAAHAADRSIAAQQPGWLRAVNRVLALRSPLRRGPRFGEVDWVDETVDQIDRAGPFPAIPLAVVSGGRRPPRWLMPEAAATARAANQASLAALSPVSRHVVAGRSGHFPQITEPDVVVDAVRWVLAAERGDAGAP